MEDYNIIGYIWRIGASKPVLASLRAIVYGAVWCVYIVPLK